MKQKLTLILLFSVIVNVITQDTIEIGPDGYPTGDDSTYYILPIVHTSDIHGHAYAAETKDDGGNVLFKAGGIDYFSTYVEKLKTDFGRVLLLDSGDVFQGGYESKVTNGDIMTKFFKTADVFATTLGNHEFDFGQDYLKEKLNNLKDKFVCANVYKKGTENPLDNTVVTNIYTFPNTDIKIGIIGMTTIQTKEASSGDMSYIDISANYKAIIEPKSTELKNKGCKAVILLIHTGFTCKDQKEEVKTSITNPQSTSSCNAEGELQTILSELPEGTIDLALGGHLHYNQHSFINKVPAVTPKDSLLYFNIAYLYFKKSDLTLDKQKTTLEGPVPVCSKLYKNLKRCYDVKDDEKAGAGSLVPFTFHGKVIDDKGNPNVISILEENKGKIEAAEKEIVFELTDDIGGTFLGRNKTGESFMGNLVSDIYRQSTNADFAFVNHGLFRTTWTPGNISLKNFYDMFPFDNTVIKATTTGKDIKKILESIELQSGDDAKGYYAFSGATVSYDVEKHKVKSMKMIDGKKINDKKEYVIASNDYMLKTYGDDMAKLKGEITLQGVESIGDQTDIFLKFLKGKKVKTSEYYNPEEARFINPGSLQKVSLSLVLVLVSLLIF